VLYALEMGYVLNLNVPWFTEKTFDFPRIYWWYYKKEH
jgi:hypothetical protein